MKHSVIHPMGSIRWHLSPDGGVKHTPPPRILEAGTFLYSSILLVSCPVVHRHNMKRSAKRLKRRLTKIKSTAKEISGDGVRSRDLSAIGPVAYHLGHRHLPGE